MSGSGYDYSTSIYSNDGRVFQIEYAQKAADLSGTALGIRAKDGVVLACESFPGSSLIIPHTQQRILPVTYNIGMVSSGLLADGRYLTKQA